MNENRYFRPYRVAFALKQSAQKKVPLREGRLPLARPDRNDFLPIKRKDVLQMYTLEINTAEKNGVIIVALVGEIDANTAPILEAELLPIARRHDRLVLEVSGVQSVSSVGLRKILMLYRTIKVHNGQILLAGMNENLRSIMWSAGFLNYFIVAESLEMALAAFD